MHGVTLILAEGCVANADQMRVWDGGHVVTLLVANAATDTVVVQPSTTITFQITGIQVPAKPLEVVVAVFVAGDAGPVVLSSGNARIGS